MFPVAVNVANGPGGNRTRTSRRTRDFKSPASANSATGPGRGLQSSIGITPAASVVVRSACHNAIAAANDGFAFRRAWHCARKAINSSWAGVARQTSTTIRFGQRLNLIGCLRPHSWLCRSAASRPAHSRRPANAELRRCCRARPCRWSRWWAGQGSPLSGRESCPS